MSNAPGRGGVVMARKKTPAGTREMTTSARPIVCVCTLEVFLIGGPVTDEFAKKNPVVSRTIEVLGGQTLEDLHHAIFTAFGRFEQHAFEFQLGGKGPMDPQASRYVLPGV